MYVTLQKYLMSLRNLLPRAYFILILQDIEILQPINTKFFFLILHFFPRGYVFPQIPLFTYHLPMPSILLFMERELT